MRWYEPEDPTPREACPCCGYVTLAERGSWLICDVCFWEDEPIGDAHYRRSSANRMTLAEARKNFATIGAVEERLLKHVLPVAVRASIERRPIELTDPFPSREQCPCCGYVTLPERGRYFTCRVCFWEDEPSIRDAHHVYCTVNHTTLAEARKSFATIGAAKERSLEYVLPVADLAHIERRPVELTDPFPPREQCPRCGYVTLPERGKDFTCRVCFWEDDASIRGAHHVYSIRNRTTLAEARKSFATICAAQERSSEDVLPIAALAHIERRPVELTDPFPLREQCPCCGYISIPALREQWRCAVCEWKDDGKPLHVTDTSMGTTLWMARARFARSGITDDRFERRPLVDRDASLPTHPCPCCDHVTLVERAAGLSCPLCGWLDDVAATARDVYSESNACTLADARARFAAGQMVVYKDWGVPVDREGCALFEHRPIPDL